MQIVEDLLAEHTEDGNHTEGDGHRLQRHPALHLCGAAGGEGKKDRGDPGGIHNHKKREKKGSEDSDVEHSEPCEERARNDLKERTPKPWRRPGGRVRRNGTQ
ncbi:hypothetical protein GCM10010207_03390 [Streptomyces atratus]|nr:hypothetical protein GCM10010207_03390 [Streptomyces atratus]